MTVIDEANRMAHLISWSTSVTTAQSDPLYMKEATKFIEFLQFFIQTEVLSLSQNFGKNYVDHLGRNLALALHIIHRPKE